METLFRSSKLEAHLAEPVEVPVAATAGQIPAAT
jgi:hypothetical protein